MWFCVDSCGNVEVFQTAEAAKKSAEDALELERDAAGDGWSEDVTNIMWGKVHQCVVQTLCRPRTDEDSGVSSDFDEIADYGLVDAKQ